MVSFSNFLSKILAQYIEYDNAAYTLPENIVNIVQIHHSFLNMSYIYFENHTSWIYIFVVLARPSVTILISYFYIVTILYIIAHTTCIIYKNIPGMKIISLINSLMKVGLLNFVIEQCNDVLGYIVGAFILFIQIIEILFIQGTLDINTKNFQLTQISFLKIFSFGFNILMMIFYNLKFKLNIIQILAIINSSTQLLDLFYVQNHRNSFIRTIMISVQFITIYVGIMQFIHYEDSYTLVILPLFYKIVSQINVSKVQSDDQIINASILLQQRKFYECFIILNKIKDQNLIRKVKKNVLLKKCVQFINADMLIKLQNQELLGVAEKLIKNDYFNLKISNGIQRMITWKIKILQNWKNNDFQEIYLFVDKMLQLKQQIDNYYLSEPNSMIQSLICFFYAEILNDLLEANEMIMGAKKAADLYITNIYQNKKLFYIITTYENGQLKILKISSNAPSFICNKQLQELIPFGVKECHNKLIDEFITNGESKFVRNMKLNYITHGQYIDSVNFAIDLTYLNQVNFICLIQPISVKHSVLIVDSNYQITCSTNYFSDFQNHKQLFAKGTLITQLFPEVSQVKESCYLENVTIFKFTQQMDEHSSDINYVCCLDIIYKSHLNEMLYMIIKIENMHTVYNNSKSNYISTKRDVQSNESSDKCLSIAEENSKMFQMQQLESLQNNTMKILTEDGLRKALNLDILQNQVLTSRCEPEQMLLCDKQLTNSKKQSIKSFSNDEKKNQLVQSNKQKKEDAQLDREDQSQVSSIKMLRNSKFYRKYDLFNKFNKHTPLKGYHQTLISIFILSIFIQGIFIVIQISNLNLVSFAVDINLLEIKNRFFQPLDQFLVTRWNLWTYNFQKTNGIITIQEYNTQSKYAQSNLGLGFDSLNSNLKLVLNRQELQNLLRLKYLDIYSYLDTFKNEQYNMTLRTAISVLLNFQYILKMNYIYEKTVKADSPQIFYSFMNYPLLRDIMTQLNHDIMQQTLLRGENFQSQLDTLFIFQQVLLFCFIVIIIYMKIYINKKLMLFLHISQYSDIDAIQQEILNLKTLQDNIQSDNSYKFNYQLNLDEKEADFLELKMEKVMRNSKSFKKKSIPLFKFLFCLACFYLILSLNSVINYIEFQNYLNKYPQTAIYKKQIADLGGDIPLMFAQREVLYGRKNYMYLNAEYFDRMWFYIQESLNRTKLFASYDPDFQLMLVSDKFEQYYKELISNDLCPYLPEEQIIRAGDLCYITMNQNMKRGFKAMIIYIINLIETDRAINNFTYRALPTSNELEGAFMIAELINVINLKFYDDLITLTTQLVDQQEIFNIFYLIILIFILFIIATNVQNKLYENSRIIVHFVYLIPSQTLFTDDTFERTLRMLLNF